MEPRRLSASSPNQPTHDARERFILDLTFYSSERDEGGGNIRPRVELELLMRWLRRDSSDNFREVARQEYVWSQAIIEPPTCEDDYMDAFPEALRILREARSTDAYMAIVKRLPEGSHVGDLMEHVTLALLDLKRQLDARIRARDIRAA